MYTCTYLYGDQRVFTERSRACAAPVLSSCGGLLVGCYLAACCYLIGTSGTVLLWGGLLYGAILYLAVHVFIRHRLHYVSNFVAFGSVSALIMFFLLGLGSFLQMIRQKFPSFVHGGLVLGAMGVLMSGVAYFYKVNLFTEDVRKHRIQAVLPEGVVDVCSQTEATEDGQSVFFQVFRFLKWIFTLEMIDDFELGISPDVYQEPAVEEAVEMGAATRVDPAGRLSSSRSPSSSTASTDLRGGSPHGNVDASSSSVEDTDTLQINTSSAGAHPSPAGLRAASCTSAGYQHLPQQTAEPIYVRNRTLKHVKAVLYAVEDMLNWLPISGISGRCVEHIEAGESLSFSPPIARGKVKHEYLLKIFAPGCCDRELAKSIVRRGVRFEFVDVARSLKKGRSQSGLTAVGGGNAFMHSYIGMLNLKSSFAGGAGGGQPRFLPAIDEVEMDTEPATVLPMDAGLPVAGLLPLDSDEEAEPEVDPTQHPKMPGHQSSRAGRTVLSPVVSSREASPLGGSSEDESSARNAGTELALHPFHQAPAAGVGDHFSQHGQVADDGHGLPPPLVGDPDMMMSLQGAAHHTGSCKDALSRTGSSVIGSKEEAAAGAAQSPQSLLERCASQYLNRCVTQNSKASTPPTTVSPPLISLTDASFGARTNSQQRHRSGSSVRTNSQASRCVLDVFPSEEEEDHGRRSESSTSRLQLVGLDDPEQALHLPCSLSTPAGGGAPVISPASSAFSRAGFADRSGFGELLAGGKSTSWSQEGNPASHPTLAIARSASSHATDQTDRRFREYRSAKAEARLPRATLSDNNLLRLASGAHVDKGSSFDNLAGLRTDSSEDSELSDEGSGSSSSSRSEGGSPHSGSQGYLGVCSSTSSARCSTMAGTRATGKRGEFGVVGSPTGRSPQSGLHRYAESSGCGEENKGELPGEPRPCMEDDLETDVDVDDKTQLLQERKAKMGRAGATFVMSSAGSSGRKAVSSRKNTLLGEDNFLDLADDSVVVHVTPTLRRIAHANFRNDPETATSRTALLRAAVSGRAGGKMKENQAQLRGHAQRMPAQQQLVDPLGPPQTPPNPMSMGHCTSRSCSAVYSSYSQQRRVSTRPRFRSSTISPKSTLHSQQPHGFFSSGGRGQETRVHNAPPNSRVLSSSCTPTSASRRGGAPSDCAGGLTPGPLRRAAARASAAMMSTKNYIIETSRSRLQSVGSPSFTGTSVTGGVGGGNQYGPHSTLGGAPFPFSPSSPQNDASPSDWIAQQQFLKEAVTVKNKSTQPINRLRETSDRSMACFYNPNDYLYFVPVQSTTIIKPGDDAAVTLPDQRFGFYTLKIYSALHSRELGYCTAHRGEVYVYHDGLL